MFMTYMQFYTYHGAPVKSSRRSVSKIIKPQNLGCLLFIQRKLKFDMAYNH